MNNIINAARSVQSYVAEVRGHLHSHPETRWEETRTLALVHIELNRMFENGNTPVVCCLAEGGLWCDLTFDPTWPRIIFRADVDALPVQEATCLEFASSVVGRMHACGHDVHTAMLLGFAKLVAEDSIKPNCNLRLVFQRAEENPGTAPRPESGGEVLVKQDGVLEGVSTAYGLHIWNSSASGTPGVFYSRPGGFLGNSGRLQIKISCSGGHAAMPHEGTNALRVTAAIQNRLDTFVARRLVHHGPVALEPVILKAGTGSNIMPASAELWYGVRTTLPRNYHNSFMAEIEQEIRYVVAQFGAEVSFNRILGHPALINNPESFNRVASILRDAGEQVEVHPPILGGEDFAHYLYGVPGSFWLLGARAPGTGDHHSPTFNPDESVFWKGVLFWLLLATS